MLICFDHSVFQVLEFSNELTTSFEYDNSVIIL